MTIGSALVNVNDNEQAMEVDTTAAGQPIITRDKTTPFLIRTFVKIGSFHRLTLFEDGTLPTTDEQQVFTWKDATLREVVTTLRNIAPHVAEYKHPLARFNFRTVYADSGNKGRFAFKDLGMVYSRDILGEPGTTAGPANRLLQDNEEQGEREKQERTLDELRFVPGDYLLVCVLLPKNVTTPGEISVKGAGATGKGRSDTGWGGPIASAPSGRGGGHWRGSSDAPPARGGRGVGRGGGLGRDRDRERDRDEDRRPPPPRRGESPPPRGGGWGRSRGRSRSPRSRSPPPPRRRGRYD